MDFFGAVMMWLLVIGTNPATNGVRVGVSQEEPKRHVDDRLIEVPGGQYMIGATNGGNRTLPRHMVTIKSFAIFRHEVSVADYRRCVVSNDCDIDGVEHESSGWRTECNWGAPDREEHPMNCVTWSQAQDYCDAAGTRLPTEAEWEIAARGPDGLRYPWGNTFDPDRLAWGKGQRGTRPVDSLTQGASPFGLLHMAGNVWEWVQDVNVWDWVNGRLVRDPVSNPRHEGEFGRVMRGGGWTADKPSAVLRHGAFPQHRGPALGFRCARTSLQHRHKSKGDP